ncbi:MAG: serine hydrolase, partial [Mariniphaga sp.]|nr:serine hydrolase [Mariniphaga sp.]
MKRHLSIVLISLLILFSCENQNNIPSLYPLAEINGINEELLISAVEKAKLDGGIKSLIINRNGDTVIEEYFVNDGPDSLYHVQSVTKSIVSILIGIAIEKDFLDLNETVGNYLSEYVDSLNPSIASITIKNLLTMSGGFEWDEMTDFVQYFNPWASAENNIKYVLKMPMSHEPGEIFTYNTAACQLLSAIIYEATGLSLDEFGEAHFFQPLGITNRIWYADYQGFNYGGAMLLLSPPDMLKIGLLYLNKGSYNGQQIVSESWVNESHFPHYNTNNVIPYGSEYGYFWWIGNYQGHHLYFANDYGGQFIFIVPDFDLVVVARSDSYLADPN